MATKRTATKKGAAKKKTAGRPKKQKAVFLRGFTGTVRQNADKTISIVGKGKRGRG